MPPTAILEALVSRIPKISTEHATPITRRTAPAMNTSKRNAYRISISRDSVALVRCLSTSARMVLGGGLDSLPTGPAMLAITSPDPEILVFIYT